MEKAAQDAADTELCVMFADISGSTRLYERLGDREASSLVNSCLDEMKSTVLPFQGRVVMTIGDEILVAFASPEKAVMAASDMLGRVGSIPTSLGYRLTLRIGLNFGPVIEDGGNILGDTVNTAARIVGLAKAGQILASKTMVGFLPASMREASRDIAAFKLKGKSEEIGICEILWQEERRDITIQYRNSRSIAPRASRLVLGLDEKRYRLERKDGELTLGRDLSNDIVINDPRISRWHAKIECRRDKFVLSDSSTNGTWVLFEGNSEFQLKHEEVVLHDHGLITLGRRHDRLDTLGSMEFRVE
ncbi:MAG: adenylate/guanylate cyclase domain-containing protein [Methylococcaceae bacterium]|nr:adenylate/guanylate cyclase domain-containing protein [Methylococcaceae bacterium]